MKKVISLTLVALMVTMLLSGCSNSSEIAELRQEVNTLKSEVAELKEQITTPASQLTEPPTEMTALPSTSNETPANSELLDMAKTADTADGVQYILQQNSSVEVQVAIANSGTYEGQKALLNYSGLTAEALVAICKNPKSLNLISTNVQNWFQSAIERTTLTSEQEVEIANTGKYAIQKALLLRTNLTGAGLVALCKTPKVFNFSSTNVQSWFQSALERTTLTSEQEVEIANTGEYAIQKALLLRTNLTAEGLIALCKNPKGFNLCSMNVQSWFENAVKRITFTKEQELQLAKTGNARVQKGLIK